MSDNTIQLLHEAAEIFARLATAYEQDMQNMKYRVDCVECRTEENRVALKAAAEAILKNLD